LFWNYTKMMLKDTLLYVNFLVGLAGVAIVYFTKLDIPYGVFVLFPIIALYISGYKIYKNSAPSITIFPPDKDDTKISYELGFEIVMKARITNFSNRSGSLEDINLRYVGVNWLRDKFLINNLMFSVEKPLILKRKPDMLLAMKPYDYKYNYPQIISANSNEYIYFLVKLYVSASQEEKFKETLEWLEFLEFELEYKYKDNHKTHLKKAEVLVETDNLYEIYQSSLEERKRIEELFEDIK
jgi:hypothetical protein